MAKYNHTGSYSYGMPAWLIWAVHIIIGAGLVYLGRQVVRGEALPTNVGLGFVALGALQVAYHGHLWLLSMAMGS